VPADAAADGAISDASDGPPARGPTPARPGHNFPFPQNREQSRCVYPRGYRNEDVQAAYDLWKRETVTADGANGFRRVKRLASDPVIGMDATSTVSEGIAYGMMMAVYMDDQALFDDLWRYEQRHLDPNGLMDWHISSDGMRVLGGGAATDADEDMAFALLMAERQWGGMGMLAKTYMQLAREQIDLVWRHEVLDGKLIKPGDTWGAWSVVNISYFAPSYYRLFARVDGNTTGWNDVIKTVYDTIDNALSAENGNETNGLVPAWCTSDGAPNPNVFQGGGAPTHYQYDSCRTPFRIGLYWCWFGETRARDYVAKTSTFFAGKGAAAIVDGYDLNGAARPFKAGERSAAFIGPAGVGAMSSATYQSFVDDAYAAVATRSLLAGGAYYEYSWTVLSLLQMTGNFIDYTAL
jgi:endo-1,4-beta-D-glucanase Y